MSFKSFLDAIGNDAKAVFAFVASPKGQAEITAGEAAAVTVTAAINPAAGLVLSGVETLVNAGLTEVVKVEQLAASAGAQSGTGAQKAAAVAQAVTPQITSLLESLGVSAPTATQVQSVASALTTGLVGVLNALPASTTTAS